MECCEAIELLSAYHDDELPAEVRSSVAEHVEGCSRCGEELALFGQLSAMAGGLGDPEPPQEIWAGIEAGLGLDKKGEQAFPRQQRKYQTKRKWHLGPLTTAALVLVGAGLMWLGGRIWLAPGHHSELAADFGNYLEHFASNPETAQNVLLAKYDGRAVDVTEATRQLGYRPAVAAGLPQRYSLEAMYVLNMPCCTCVQTICRRDDGEVYAIFEHMEQPEWFGDRPRIETQCNGCACSIIQSDRVLAASWEANKRHFTVVGAGDLEEIADLIDHFQDENPNA